MAQPPHRPPSSPSRTQKNHLDDRGVEEPPDESINGGSSSSQLPTTTMEGSPGHLTASDPTTTPSSSPNRSQQLRRPQPSRHRRLYNRSPLQRPLSTPTSSPSWRWSFTTFRHARQQHQQHLQRTRMSTLLKRRTFPPLSQAFKTERHRLNHTNNNNNSSSSSSRFTRRYYHEDPHDQGSQRQHRRNSFSAFLSSWRIGGGGSSSHLYRLSVRSSMILHENALSSDFPEVLYDDDEGNDEGSSLSSFGSSTCTHCANDEPCPRHPPQRHRLYNLKKDGSGSGNKRSSSVGAAGGLVLLRSSEKFIRPPTISSLSSSLSVVVLPQRPLHYHQDQHRFSAFWYDGEQGRSGKRQVHVDSLGQVQKNNKQYQDEIQSALFLFGFLFFPFWWIGAWLHCRKHAGSTDPEKKQPTAEFGSSSSSSLSLVNARVIGKVNCCMTCVSLMLIAAIIALGVWLRYWKT